MPLELAANVVDDPAELDDLRPQSHGATWVYRDGGRNNKSFAHALSASRRNFRALSRSIPECLDHGSSPINLRPFTIVEDEFRWNRKLIKAIPPGNLGPTLGDWAFLFWRAVQNISRRARRRLQLEELNFWRNAIVTKISIP